MAKRLCNATNCKMEIRGCDIPNHYKTKTDWKLLEQLKCMSSAVAEDMQGHRLVDRDLGLAVSTFRKEQTLKSKFSCDFWMKSDV